VIGIADGPIRTAVFDWLAEQRNEGRETLPWKLLAGFETGGRSVPLVGLTGIWKPAVCELPISITTSARGVYPDRQDYESGRVHYRYRGEDPDHRDNRSLRRAWAERVPLVYFYGVAKGAYLASWPAFVVDDSRATLTFTIQIDDPAYAFRQPAGDHVLAEDRDEARRAYVTRSERRRVHQATFRERVIRAYQERCALCSLRHRELLDAAHIIPDRDPEGEPLVSNGVALCKLHHAALDGFFFAIRPDYSVEVRQSILDEQDGPMLVVGLQRIHGQQILLPRRPIDRPDPRRLERRYGEFLQAGQLGVTP
jgi:putative restriction endonuclease